jgi:hypothetical protein
MARRRRTSDSSGMPHAETYMFTISDPLGLDLRGEGGAVVVPRGRRHGSCCVPAQTCPRRQLATQPQRKAPAARRHTRDGIVRPLSLGGERVEDIADIIRDADQPGHPVRGPTAAETKSSPSPAETAHSISIAALISRSSAAALSTSHCSSGRLLRSHGSPSCRYPIPSVSTSICKS